MNVPFFARGVVAVREALENLRLPLATAGAPQARALRDQLLQQIDDYVIPRLTNLEAPLLAVVGGSTGAGKSTLVNSLVGREVSASSALRPTTREPVLVHAPADAHWFRDARILPQLRRTDAAGSGTGTVRLVADESLPAGLALLDAPDVDSVDDENRALSRQLLAAADLWVFVTTANRYADAVPWQLLEAAGARNLTVALVLDRVPAGAADAIEPDLQRMLTARGLESARIFKVEETVLDQHGMLPDAATHELRAWLNGIAQDQVQHHAIAFSALEGSLDALGDSMVELTAARAQQHEAATALVDAAEANFGQAREAVLSATSDGTLLRGEVLARWQDFVGTGELFRGFDRAIGITRDFIAGWFGGRPAQAERVEQELASGVQAILVDAAETAAGNTWRQWHTMPAGAELAVDPALARASSDLPERAAELVREWRGSILELVREQAAPRRTRARILSLGVNALAVSLMIVVFASTAGLTGGEIAIAGGSAVIGQKLLESIFGEDAVRRLAALARDDLDQRVQGLLEAEERRFTELVRAVDTDPTALHLQEVSEEFVRPPQWEPEDWDLDEEGLDDED